MLHWSCSCVFIDTLRELIFTGINLWSFCEFWSVLRKVLLQKLLKNGRFAKFVKFNSWENLNLFNRRTWDIKIMYLLMHLDVNSVIGQKNLKIFVRNVSFNLLNLSLVNLLGVIFMKIIFELFVYSKKNIYEGLSKDGPVRE